MAAPSSESKSSSTYANKSVTEQVTNGSSNTTPLVIRWTNEIQVNELVHASDNFNILVGATLALLAAAVAAASALGAGAVHPVIIYIILSACGFGGLITGGLSKREYNNVRSVRSEIKASTTEYRIPFTLTPGTSSSPGATSGTTVGMTQIPNSPIRPKLSRTDPTYPQRSNREAK
jgi:hypothetical protein